MKRLHAIFLLLVKTEFVTVGQYLSWKVIQMVKIIIFKNPIFRFYALNLDDVEWNVHGCVIYKSQKKHFQILEGEEWFCAGSDVILLPEFWQTHTHLSAPSVSEWMTRGFSLTVALIPDTQTHIHTSLRIKWEQLTEEKIIHMMPRWTERQRMNKDAGESQKKSRDQQHLCPVPYPVQHFYSSHGL